MQIFLAGDATIPLIERSLSSRSEVKFAAE
jgi:hypothetical protein